MTTSDRNQPFCKKYDSNIDCFDGKRKYPRNITQRVLHQSTYVKIHFFFLVWKSNGTSFNQAIEQLNLNFRVVANVISDKQVYIIV